jgi:serine/threonine protein kinase
MTEIARDPERGNDLSSSDHKDLPTIGSRIASYRIEGVLGSGGMATVFRALDERLGRQVALKVLRPEIAEDPAFRQRFIRESRVAAAVDHPNIIPIFDAGDADGILFIAMRYVRGGDVRLLLASDGPLPPDRAMEIIAPAASALDAAHAAGLVHRDVKPSNLLLDSRSGDSPHVYLADFGVTTRLSEAASITNAGLVIGTTDYMSPEQIQGAPVDGRADQYELACTAFEILTGSPPFAGREDVAVLYAHMHESPPTVTSRRPELPLAVDDVFARAMAKSPGKRFSTCGQFAEALIAAFDRARDKRETFKQPGRSINIPLKKSFRYIHEPSGADEDAIESLGNDALISELKSRIIHSRGGTFLVTGFRGVGKSTLALRAMDEIVAHSAPTDIILPVTLSVARSTTTERLLFAIVRRVFEALSDSGALQRLPAETRHALLVAYMRTSLSFKETQSEARERSAGMDLSIGPGKAVKAVADFTLPKISMSAKRSHSLATEASFLAYSETDAEYDLMRIVSLVDGHRRDSVKERHILRRLWPWRSRPVVPRLHLVIVLDEVDKLTSDETGMASVEELLSGIKNVLTMTGAHFLIIAGPDLHDRAVRDAARGNGVYESIFGWRLYVPCIWDAPERLIADIAGPSANVATTELEQFAHYLRFKARGTPRRLLQEVNSFIAWDSDLPFLRIGPKEMRRIEFYARLERILLQYIEGRGHSRLFPIAIDEDRWRLSGYYVVDWVLQSEGKPFSAADLLRQGDDADFDPLLRISRRNVDRLLDHLAEHQILEIVHEMNASATMYGDIAESSDKIYCLAEEIRQLLYGFAARNESERGAREVSLAPADAGLYNHPTDIRIQPAEVAVAPGAAAWAEPSGANPSFASEGPVPEATPPEADAPSVVVMPAARVIGGRYELGELIGQGGLASMYKGRDIATGRQVVIKLLRTALSQDDAVIARIRREADVAKRLVHPQIVRMLDVLEETDHGPALIMEWLNGTNLAKQISDEGPMEAPEAAGIGRILTIALEYLADQKVVRLDLKPNNVIMTPDRGPVITDLGIAFRLETQLTNLTATGQLVGTPAFMAPELIEGIRPDARVDIYALGLVLYYCLAGRGPWDNSSDEPNSLRLMWEIMSKPVEVDVLPVSQEFRSALGTAVAHNRDERFSDAAAFRDALSKTPEWRSVSEGRGRS